MPRGAGVHSRAAAEPGSHPTAEVTASSPGFTGVGQREPGSVPARQAPSLKTGALGESPERAQTSTEKSVLLPSARPHVLSLSTMVHTGTEPWHALMGTRSSSPVSGPGVGAQKWPNTQVQRDAGTLPHTCKYTKMHTHTPGHTANVPCPGPPPALGHSRLCLP